MKNLLLTILFTLVLIGSASAERINLVCSYLNTYYQDWDEGKFGQTIVSDQTQSVINFSILKENQNYDFETNLLYNWDWIKNSKKFDDIVNEGEYKFIAKDNSKYLLIRLNRFDGRLEILSGYTNDDNKYQWKETFYCIKTQQKF